MNDQLIKAWHADEAALWQALQQTSWAAFRAALDRFCSASDAVRDASYSQGDREFARDVNAYKEAIHVVVRRARLAGSVITVRDVVEQTLVERGLCLSALDQLAHAPRRGGGSMSAATRLKKQRMTREEANARGMELLKADKSFADLSETKQAKQIGCSWATWSKTPLYLDLAKHRRKSAPKGGTRAAVNFSSKVEAKVASGRGRAEQARNDDVVDDLISEQEADYEPSPLDPRPTKVRAHKRY
jgi:hypothetical protein